MSDELAVFLGMWTWHGFLEVQTHLSPTDSAEMLASDLQLDFSISSLPRRNRWRLGGDGDEMGWSMGQILRHFCFVFCVSKLEGDFVFFGMHKIWPKRRCGVDMNK